MGVGDYPIAGSWMPREMGGKRGAAAPGHRWVLRSMVVAVQRYGDVVNVASGEFGEARRFRRVEPGRRQVVRWLSDDAAGTPKRPQPRRCSAIRSVNAPGRPRGWRGAGSGPQPACLDIAGLATTPESDCGAGPDLDDGNTGRGRPSGADSRSSVAAARVSSAADDAR